MIKNIILDVGGILFDDSKRNIGKILNTDGNLICKNAYGKGFKECLLGTKTVQEHINSLSNLSDYENIKYILDKDNLSKLYPLIEENFEYIKVLKERGYKLYLLTNITEDFYNYIDSLLNINTFFDGGVYSYQEHLIKPDPNIYKLLIDKFNLKLEETIFFDDKGKNVIGANKIGIKSFLFNSIKDIENNL